MSHNSVRLARRGRSRRLMAFGAVAAASALMLSGCAGGVQTNFDEGFSVTAAAGQVPSVDANTYEFMAVDIAAIAELAGIERTDDPFDWLVPLTGLGSDVSIYLPLPDVFLLNSASSAFDDLGWNLTDVDRLVNVTAPPLTFTTVAGTFPALPSRLTAVNDRVFTDADSEDFTVDLSNVGAVIDRLGRATRFAQDGNRIAMTTSTPMADAWVGSGETLADDASVRAIAETLDEYGAMSAIITQPAQFSGQTILGPDVTPEQAEAALAQYDVLVPPAPYDMVGIGWTVVDGTPRWIASYHFATEDDAKDGAQVLRAVWEKGSTITTNQLVSSLATVDDVFVKDTTVAVVLTPTADTTASTLYQLLMTREVLFASR